MPMLPQQEWPEELQHPKVYGIFIGGCIERGDGSRFRASGHAHITGRHTGFICYLSQKSLACREGNLHELAHLISGCGHTDKWRTTLLDIGGTLDEVYDEKGNCVLRSYKKVTKKDRARCPAAGRHKWIEAGRGYSMVRKDGATKHYRVDYCPACYTTKRVLVRSK